MLYLLKLFPEITIKSRPVRRRFIRQLRKNLRSVLSEFDEGIQVSGEWDCLEIETSATSVETQGKIVERLRCTPGIAQFSQVNRHPLPDFDRILELARDAYGERLPGQTFAVRCRRTGKHPFKSVDVERFVGAGLIQACATAGVRLKNPDVTVAMEIRDDYLYLIREQHPGLGGFPLGCQDSVLSLISGGFDSSVSSYLCIRRGLQTHYCFFNLGGKAHELAVKEVALFLWMKYHSSHRVKFVSVPFEGVVAEILQSVQDSQMGVILKRMMMRAASEVARHLHIDALVTGESVAQVSSQTLPNLAIIDQAADRLVLRPLSTTDKQGIIDLAREIGSEEFSRNIPEYCAVISRNPTTKGRLHRIEAEEARFDDSVLEEAVANARYQLITEVVDDFGQHSAEVTVVGSVAPGSVVIDIRHPDELELSPLRLPADSSAPEVLNIPFYQLRSDFQQLDRGKRYLLYCDKGMMSRLHAAHLGDEGFENIAVLDLRQAAAKPHVAKK